MCSQCEAVAWRGKDHGCIDDDRGADNVGGSHGMLTIGSMSSGAPR